ncbi:MAG: DUF2652 domain-containing protein [Myxococcota bacterium]
MANRRGTGWLLLADISGYTAFLTGSELEHAHDILKDLMRGIISGLRAPVRVVKLEGDAVFAYAPAEELPDGAALVGTLEDIYHAFRMQLFNVERSTTCTCKACQSAPRMDLKFMIHFGEYLVHDLAGHDDLEGSDVILVHRLLKNEVPEKLGKRAYILATQAARERMGTLEWMDHVESYEHLGEVRCGVRCLHAAFAELQQSGARDITAETANAVTCFEVPLSPQEAWAWCIDDDKATQWQSLDAWSVKPTAQGRKGLGSAVHCAHGESTKEMRIIAWRPWHSVTFDGEASGPMPAMMLTMTFEPIDDGARTRVRWLVRFREQSLKTRIIGVPLRLMFTRMARKDSAKLVSLLGTRQPQPA